MKRILLLILLFSCQLATAQDYFEDIKGNGTPLSFNNTRLFSSRINVGDNSIKANLFHQYKVNEEGFDHPGLARHKVFIGWGLWFKTKTEDGLGALFNSGDFNPGFGSGAYLTFHKRTWSKNDEGTNYRSWILAFSANINYSQYRLYDASKSFSSQLYDTNFTGYTLGLSFLYRLHPNRSNLYLGASCSINKVNNYGKLDKVEVKDDTAYTNNGINRTAATVDDDGNVYGRGHYQVEHTVKLRFNTTYVPGSFDHQLGFLIYPSVDLSVEKSAAKFNIGFALSFLEKGSPTNNIAALMFELNDINNVNNSTKPFFKRSFSVGITASLNVLKGKTE